MLGRRADPLAGRCNSVNRVRAAGRRRPAALRRPGPMDGLNPAATIRSWSWIGRRRSVRRRRWPQIPSPYRPGIGAEARVERRRRCAHSRGRSDRRDGHSLADLEGRWARAVRAGEFDRVARLRHELHARVVDGTAVGIGSFEKVRHGSLGRGADGNIVRFRRVSYPAPLNIARPTTRKIPPRAKRETAALPR